MQSQTTECTQKRWRISERSEERKTDSENVLEQKQTTT